MSNVVKLGVGQIHPDTCRLVQELDADIASAIELAKSLNVPQGLIVAVLHGHAHCQTSEMVGE
jgi:hypothetical protein